MSFLDTVKEGDEIVYLGGSDYGDTCLEKGKVYHVRAEVPIGRYIECERRHCRVHIVHIHPNNPELNSITDVYNNHHPILDFDPLMFKPFIKNSGGWIGVDLDGTLAVYDRWRGPYHIGEPIMPMVRRVQAWLDAGRCVKIFTARMTDRPLNEDGTEHDLRKVADAIQDWCYEHIGTRLEVTNVKDWHMMELWDDRAVQVRPNTGLTLAEELEAIRSAEAGKVATA